VETRGRRDRAGCGPTARVPRRVPEGEGAPYSKEASMAKLFATEARTARATPRCRYSAGTDISGISVERHLRDVRVTTIYEGTSEIQRLVISRALRG